MVCGFFCAVNQPGNGPKKPQSSVKVEDTLPAKGGHDPDGEWCGNQWAGGDAGKVETLNAGAGFAWNPAGEDAG